MTELAQLNNWYETKIWKALENVEKAESASVRAMLINWLPNIQQLLAYSRTSPTDFTLHDAQHAFRVAERMVEIIPEDVFTQLSTYELALLLLSAYLHDIGMSPNLSLVKNLYDFLLFGDNRNLPIGDLDSFRRWIDGQEEEIIIPLTNSTTNSFLLRKANLIISHYCRANHVAWGEQWIITNLSNERLGSYAQWVPDLRMICRSHHQGYIELLRDEFDPKPVGSMGMLVHPRYLAAVLRVADILEFDPERTPEVVFEHRDINPDSVIYWYKDHYVSRRFENGRLSISAEPPGARIHRAIEIMADEIEEELRLVRRLDDERPFEVAKFQEEKLYHRWILLPDIRRDIRPLNNNYEYINGAFRPNTQKVLQLLSGKELYGNELVAIRELLQNSFDAVKEEIALQRLEKQDPSNSEWNEILENMHSVHLSLEVEDGRIWLVCTDDGAGMSKKVITNNFLISGNSRRRDIRLLERRCREHGFEMERTGQFGIGVLSYFMFADFVQINTKRSSLAEDAEQNGWYFETDGISSFGELRKNQAWRQGTQIRLRIKANFVHELEKLVDRFFNEIDKEDDEKNFGEYQEVLEQLEDLRQFFWWNKDVKDIFLLKEFMIAYLKISVRQLPCKLRVSAITPENADIYFQKGWTQNPSELVNISVDSFADKWQSEKLFKKENSLESAEAKETNATLRAVIEALPNKIKECLSWKTVTGELPNKLGIYRVHIPVFKLGRYLSNYFVDIIDDTKEIFDVNVLGWSRGGDGYQFIFKPLGHLYMSWKGMAVKSPKEKYLNTDLYYSRIEEDALIEIDWDSDEAGTLSVSREQISLSEIALTAVDNVRSKVWEVYEDFANEIKDSPFSLITNLMCKF